MRLLLDGKLAIGKGALSESKSNKAANSALFVLSENLGVMP